MLGFLDTRPRLTYLARIRNPNPKMPDYHQIPLNMEEYKKEGGDPYEQYRASHASDESHGTPAPAEKKGAH